MSNMNKLDEIKKVIKEWEEKSLRNIKKNYKGGKMLEILVNESDWKGKKKRLNEILKSLKINGWGRCGTIVLFKDTSEEKGRAELKRLKIELYPETWEEDRFRNDYE